MRHVDTVTLQRHIRLRQYKPGWTLTVYEGEFEGQHLRIRADVENSYHPGETVPLDIHTPIPPMPSLTYFDRWLLARLIRIETHEAMEWYRDADGRPIYNPHRDGADRDDEDGRG